MVTANVGHSVVSHFASGEVRAVTSEGQRLMRSWTIQLGPLVEHTIKVIKHHTLSKVVTLMVDDEVFIEASAADIDCVGNEWKCTFRFTGERVLDFEVFKTNKDGVALNETGHVLEKRKYYHECAVVIPNDWDFRFAQFFVDGTYFLELPIKSPQRSEPNLAMDPRALKIIYGIATPYQVDHTASSSMALLTNHVLAKARERKIATEGFFFQCCAL